jgi:TonB family protein
VEEVRNRLREQERSHKLARRLDAIDQKLAAQAWSHAILLISSAQIEFPDEGALRALAAKARAGLKHSECESTAAAVRQFVADGALDEAEEVLRQALESYPQETTLQELRKEIEAQRSYREEWRTAQVFFGRGQYQEAEQILVWLATHTPGSKDVRELLEAVRGARASSEEKNFYGRGREKAMALLQQYQFEQAADLLRNLLSLFPGDPILERDLRSALSKRDGASEPAPEVERQPEAMPAPYAYPGPRELAAEPSFQVVFPARFRWLAVAVPSVLIAAGAIWTFTAKARVAPSARVQAAPQPTPDASRTPVAPPAQTTTRSRPEKPAATAAARRTEVPQEAALPQPLPSTLPTPPRGSAPEVGDAGPSRADNFQQPQRISGYPPVMPRWAKDRGLFGVVILEATVDKRGIVTRVTTVEGHPMLVPAARDAVQKWRYRPGMLNGEPVEAKVTIRFTFGTYPSR